MDKIDIGSPLSGDRRERFFARALNTQFVAAASDAATTIDLYDEIGYWGVNAKRFRSQLRDTSGDIVLRINSPGGDVFDGIAIYNDLLAHDGKVRVEVVGMAASIASIIAMAGDEVVMAENSFMMIHNAWTVAVGNRHDFGEVSAVLAKIDDALARTYAAQTKAGIRDIKRMMDDETWMTAKEAVEKGFATSVAPHNEAGAKAKFDLSVYARAPTALAWNAEEDLDYSTEEDIEKVLMRDAGRTRTQARSLIRDIRAGNTTTMNKSEVMPGADVDLTALAAALQSARAAFPHQN